MSDNLEKTINEIANSVVLIDSNDLVELKALLQLINTINEPKLDQQVFELGDVTERIILDDFETPEEAMDALNKAVEDLQDNYKKLHQVDDSELEFKTESISESVQDEETENEETEAELDDTLVEVASANNSGKVDSPNKEELDNNDSSELNKAAETIKEVQPEKKPASKPKKVDSSIDITKLEGYENYFSDRDNPDTILKTLKEDPELVQGFIEEGTQNLQMIENGLLALESDKSDLKLIDEIFRPFHTIKGVAGFLNLTEINSFCHGFESLLDDARKGDLKVTDALTDAVFGAIDALRTMVEAIDQARSTNTYIPHGIDLDYYNHNLNLLRLNVAGDSEDLEIKPPKNELVSTNNAVEQSGPKNVTRKSDDSVKGKSETSVRVSTDKMDILLDLVGELVLTQNMVTSNESIKRADDKRLLQDIGQLKRITTALQDLSMSLRMVPIKELFQKMNRIVRDLSRKSGKKIRLEYAGEETEIDRNMVDELYEPMVHMIRNNCDHGIEKPDERVMSGKDETGTVFLNAYYRGGLVIIEIADDGKGIDAKKIKSIAVDRGICSPDDDLTDKEIVNFIFHAGFSTAKEITDVSGRGVGMDVVRRAIEKLRGNIDVQTEVGKGTTMSIRLPLTLAIIDGVIVRVGNERFIIPTTSIKESLICPEEAYSKIAGKGETVLIRNKVIPLLRLDTTFDIEGGVKHPKEGTLMIVESDGKEAAVPINEMLDKQEIVIKSLGDGLNKIKGISGGAIMSDGRVGLIVDVPTLIQNLNESNS
jgi:two-component system chemotaxis sensor kinase CheA